MWFSVLALSTLLAAEKPKLAVLDVQPVGVEEAQAVAVAEAMNQELSRRGFFTVISAREIRTLLGMERQRQLLGCAETSCTAELSGALGARFVLQATLTKLGGSVQLSVMMLDSEKAQTVARAVRIAPDAAQLIALLPWALAEATGTPAPPAPSRVLPWTLIGVGALAVAGGGIVAVDGFSRERALRTELRDETGAYFKPLSVYQEEIDVIQRNKLGGLTSLGVGAALVGLGVFLFTRDPGGGAVAVVPTATGAAVVGVLP